MNGPAGNEPAGNEPAGNEPAGNGPARGQPARAEPAQRPVGRTVARPSAARTAVGAVGAAGIGFGAWQVLAGTPVAVGVWLAGGVIAHDAVLAPTVLALGWIVSRTLPRPAQGPVQVGALVAGSVALMSAPLWLRPLLGPVSRANPSANPLDYPRNLALVLAVIAAATAAVLLTSTGRRTIRRRRQARNARKTRPPSSHSSSRR
jgi:hypothetical protein